MLGASWWKRWRRLCKGTRQRRRRRRSRLTLLDPEEAAEQIDAAAAAAAEQIDLASDASFSCGSWVCTQGGWDSPNHKKTTEWFVVLSGARAVTDPDGTRHDFRAGDVVVLSKGWYGLRDITEQIHNVWINDAHDDIPGASTTPVVASLASFAPHMLERAGTSPERLARTFLDNGRTRAGFSSCAPGSFPGGKGKTAECVHIICGTVFLTNEDGSARRNCAGDTVVLADGWTGRWDVVERTDAVWASVTPP
ncbi:cupin domain-containing protein [Pseudoscourfieldia marina]